MTSGESGVKFETSMSTFGAISSSSSSSESDSSWCFLDLSSLVMSIGDYGCVSRQQKADNKPDSDLYCQIRTNTPFFCFCYLSTQISQPQILYAASGNNDST
jgi:hypothetical protein